MVDTFRIHIVCAFFVAVSVEQQATCSTQKTETGILGKEQYVLKNMCQKGKSFFGNKHNGNCIYLRAIFIYNA